MALDDLTIRLNQAITLIKAGQPAQARALLWTLVQQYPASELVWLWLATASSDRNERISALRQTLSINPRNEKARAALTQLTGEELPPLPPEPIVAPLPSAVPRLPPIKIEGKIVELALIVILGIAALVLLGTLYTRVIYPRLYPTATSTPTNTPLPTRTPTPTVPTPTNTPTYTPGGPTITPGGPTLPPSWTPPPSVTPRLTNTPRDTLPPPPSPTDRPTREATATFTAYPTKTEFPTDTPIPDASTPEATPQS
ncbi:MAG: hypothetical protein KF716_29005 [Anaerolineae bacterium]|nr:hypothetical protein [Anaerolineae bacterium]